MEVSGPAANGATPTTSTSTVAERPGGRHVIAYAVAYGPAGRRTRPVAFVRCPLGCGLRHLHAVTLDPAGTVRRAGCGRGEYVVVTRVFQADPAVAA